MASDSSFQRFQLAAAHDFVETGNRVAAALPIPGKRLLHGGLRKTVAGEFVGRDGAFTQPVAPPAIAGVSVGCILKAVAAQRVQDFVLNRLDGGWKIGDE